MAALLADSPRRRRRRRRTAQPPQQALDFRPPGQRRGGARPGAGRPRIAGRRPNVPHTRRAALPRHRRGVPLVVTFRVVRAVGSLRRRAGYQAMRHALVVAARRVASFRIVQLSIQRDHVHLIVEAHDTGALSRGMRALEIAFALALNARLRRSGAVIADRFHAQQITSPRRVHRSLRYVLNNWRKHKEDPRSPGVDPFSSGATFDGWADPAHVAGDPWPVSAAETWLLTTGWRRHGPIATTEVPGHPICSSVTR